MHWLIRPSLSDTARRGDIIYVVTDDLVKYAHRLKYPLLLVKALLLKLPARALEHARYFRTRTSLPFTRAYDRFLLYYLRRSRRSDGARDARPIKCTVRAPLPLSSTLINSRPNTNARTVTHARTN
eukprot:3187130-Pleurochrysis_carterae.AAC.3